MIEKLIRSCFRYGEPTYKEKSAEIDEMIQMLSQELSAYKKPLLERLEDSYQAREGAVIRSAFIDGFCTAVQLVVEVVEHQRKNQNDEYRI